MALYEKWMGGQSHLYNGVDRKAYPGSIEFLPFYAPDWEDGSVFYDQELYVNVPLMYDLISDKLIVSHYYTHSEIELINKKVDWFSILDHTFIHLGNDPSEGIGDGFYELLYDGNVKLFTKRKKIIEEQIVANKLELEVNAINQYFIYKDGNYFQVKKQSSALAALSDKKKELQVFSKKNNLDFRRRTELSLVQLVRYYDQEIE